MPNKETKERSIIVNGISPSGDCKFTFKCPHSSETVKGKVLDLSREGVAVIYQCPANESGACLGGPANVVRGDRMIEGRTVSIQFMLGCTEGPLTLN